ncbi:MAG TPA: hypothetical protein VNZ61_20210 [Roseomonas sp.]|nr:hypothetical protein [Roseomonas sp.]
MTASAISTSLSHATLEKQVDQEALLLMLSYIEAECRRLGVLEAARHAALAAAVLAEPPQHAVTATITLQ